MVCGSRAFPIVGDIGAALAHHVQGYTTDELSIVTGGAEGPDTEALRWARALDYNVVTVLPNYPRYGRAAPLWRNVEMVRAADEVVAFWDRKSKGTRHAIDCATKRGRPLTIYSDFTGLHTMSLHP